MAAPTRRALLRGIPGIALAGASLAFVATQPDPWQGLTAFHPDHRDWPAVIAQAKAAGLLPGDIRHVTEVQKGPRRGRLFLSTYRGTVIVSREGVE